MNMRFWDALKTPPKSALKLITAGRLKGKSDINPQWRLQAATELWGPVGIGWTYTVDKLWSDQLPDGQVIAHALVSVRVKDGDAWSEAVPGIGGNMLVEQERAGLHVSDEGYKMAVTDALSVAFKAFGMAADVYLGQMDTKYERKSEPAPASTPTVIHPAPAAVPQQVELGQDGDYTLGDYIAAAKAGTNADVEIKTQKHGSLPMADLFVTDPGYVKHWLVEKLTEGFAHDKAVEFMDSLPEWAKSWSEPSKTKTEDAPDNELLLQLTDVLRVLGKTDAEIADVLAMPQAGKKVWVERQIKNARAKLDEEIEF